jgi:methionine sulfoxide reductase heme-binding subunit
MTPEGARVRHPGQMARRHRLSWRLLRHHSWLASGTAALTGALYSLPSADSGFDVQRLSLATAYVGLVWLVSTLMIGPIKVLRARPRPVSDDLTRDIGIWAAITAVIHTALGLQVHFGSMLPYFFKVPGTYDLSTAPSLVQAIASILPFRIDPFGIAN